MKNPWLTEVCGCKCQAVDTLTRISLMNVMTDPADLRAVISWPDTQKTVRMAAERRLRKLVVEAERRRLKSYPGRSVMWRELGRACKPAKAGKS